MSMEGTYNRNAHRRSRSEGTSFTLEALQSSGPFGLQTVPGHLRTTSLDTSASQFLQSLALDGDNAPLQTQQGCLHPIPGYTSSHAAASSEFAETAADASWLQAEAAAATAGNKRTHSGNGRSKEESKKETLHQHKHSFTPALPAVDEADDARGPSDRDDEDYECDSDRDLSTPRARRSSGGNRRRRGGYNGRSENELLLLDPKRVKRILANRQSAARSKERRMNYTMQLEGKLQSLNSEMDKLNAQLEGLQGQSKLLLQARMELEQQVASLQLQLSQASSDNQVLISDLFALQSALGLPQVVPQPDLAGTGQHIPPQHQRHLQYNSGQYNSAQCTGQYDGQCGSNWQCDARYRSHGGCSDRTSAAAAGAAGDVCGTSTGVESAPGQQSPSEAAPAAVVSLPLYSNRSQPAQQPSRAEQEQQQESQLLHCRQPATAPPGSGVARPQSTTLPPLSAGAAARTANTTNDNTAVAAADVLLMDQLTVCTDDAAMTNADDLEMLAALLDDAQPMDPTVATATGAATTVQPAGRAPQQSINRGAASEIPQPFPAAPPEAAAASATAEPATAGLQVSGQQSVAEGMQAAMHNSSRPSNVTPSSHNVSHGSRMQTSNKHAASPTRPAGRMVSGSALAQHKLHSPAYSDPLGGESFIDDASSGSVCGSWTPGTRPQRISDSSSRHMKLPPCLWQQHPQQHGPRGGDYSSQAAAAVGTAWEMQLQDPSSAIHAGTGVATAAAAGNPAGLSGPTLGPSVSHWGSQPAECARQLPQQQQHSLQQQPIVDSGAAAVDLLPQFSNEVNFVMGANPSARHRFSESSHHRSASAGCIGSLGWTTDADTSTLPSASQAQVSFEHQHQQHLVPEMSQFITQPASSRLSAPGGSSALSQPVDALNSSCVYMPDLKSYQDLQEHQQGVQQLQHRRSFSYAGCGYPAPAAIGSSSGDAGMAMIAALSNSSVAPPQQQLQDVPDIHPAAKAQNEPGITATSNTAAADAGLNDVAPVDGQALVLPARLVTTIAGGHAAAPVML